MNEKKAIKLIAQLISDNLDKITAIITHPQFPHKSFREIQIYVQSIAEKVVILRED